MDAMVFNPWQENTVDCAQRNNADAPLRSVTLGDKCTTRRDRFLTGSTGA